MKNIYFWRSVDAADCDVSGITAYRVENIIKRKYFCSIPRKECALTFVREGGYRYELPDGRTFDCMPGEMSFLPYGSCYRHEPLVLPARMDVVYFTLRDGRGALYEFDPLDILLLTCTESERFSLLFAELCTRYFGMMTPRAEVKAVLQRILGALAREESSGILTDAELARLSPALEYLAQNNGDIRVAELAARCNLCEYAFRELFKKYAGMPPKAYIMHRRIEQVEELVLRSDITLTDAARACGFEDPSYFFKVYRRLRGHAPGMIYR